MNQPDYLVITTCRGRNLTRVWHRDEGPSFDLDFPVYWRLERKKDSVFVKRPRRSSHERDIVVAIGPEVLERGAKFNVPAEVGTSGELRVRIMKLVKPHPFFLIPPTEDTYNPVQEKLQLYAVSGAGELLIHFQPFQRVFRGYLFEQPVFTIRRAGPIFEVQCEGPGLEIWLGNKTQINVQPGYRQRLNEGDLSQAVFRYGHYWWRIQMLPMPKALNLPRLPDKERIEKERTKKIGTIVGGALTLFLALASVVPQSIGQKRVISSTEVVLKEPKWIPPEKEALKSPEPKVRPKPVVLKPPPTPPVEKKVAKTKPKPQPHPHPHRQKIVRHEPPPAPAPAPPKPTSPSPAQIAAAAEKQHAKQMAEAKTQLENSLNFVSPSKHRAQEVANNPNGTSSLNNKYDSDNKLKLDKNEGLNKITGPAVDNSDSISTKGARALSSEYGVGRGKTAGKVLGRVALKGIQEGGGSLDGASAALQISGSGNVSEKDIQRALEKHLQRFQYCYEKALLSDSSISGVVRLEWTLTESGGVQASHVITSQIANRTMQNCLLRELSKVNFPRPQGGAVTIQYPFSFESGTI